MNRRVKPRIICMFLLPGLAMYLYFFLIPAIKAFFFSLTEWNGFSSDKKFIGLANYKEMLSDKQLGQALGNTLFYLIVGGIITFTLVFLFTYVLTRKGFKGRKIISNYFYFPNMISQSALAVLWVFVFSSNFGLLDAVLKKIGLENLITPWLGTRWRAMTCITLASCICSVGFYLILMLSAYDRINADCLEAASLDGATDIQIYFKVSIPLMRNVTVIAVSLWIINSIKFFDLIWAMFRGLTTYTQTLGTYMYTMAFGAQVPIYRLGYASAVAVLMLVLVVILSGTFRKVFDRNDLQY